MAVAMVVGTGAFIGISTLNTLVDKLVPSNDGSNFGEETLNDSTIEHEEKNNKSATFLFDFKNGSTTLIIIIIGGIVTLLLAIGCCIFFCGCSRFNSRFCCRKANTTTEEPVYRERYCELQRQIFTPAKITEMRSTQHQRQVNNQAKIIEMRSTQNDNKIEEIVQLPNVDQTLYTVISKKEEEKKSPYRQRQRSPCKEPRERK